MYMQEYRMDCETAIEKSIKDFVFTKIQEQVYLDVSRSNTISIRPKARHGSIALAMFWLRVLRHQNNFPMPKYPYKEVYDRQGKNKVILKVDSVTMTTFMACGTLTIQGAWVLEWFLNTFPTIMTNYDGPVKPESLTSSSVYRQYTESWKKLQLEDKLKKDDAAAKEKELEDRAIEVLTDRTIIITKTELEEPEKEENGVSTSDKLREAAKLKEDNLEEAELLTLDIWSDNVLEKQLGKLHTCQVHDASTYIYPLWKSLLHKWLADASCKVYIVTPFLDTQRLADICNIVLDHRITANLESVYVQRQCGPKQWIHDVKKEALDMFNTKQQMYLEYKIYSNMIYPANRFSAAFIGCIKEEAAEVLVTSASFHGNHFDSTSMDSVHYQKMSDVDLICKFLAQINGSLLDVE